VWQDNIRLTVCKSRLQFGQDKHRSFNS